MAERRWPREECQPSYNCEIGSSWIVRRGCSCHAAASSQQEDTGFVANQEQLELLKDVDAWNNWKEGNPRLTPDLSGGDLSNADLRVANLVGVDLSGATLLMANLNGADLRGANLSGANLVGARLVGADIEDANLSSADLRTAEDLTQEQLNETRGNESTVLPDGLVTPASWLAKGE